MTAQTKELKEEVIALSRKIHTDLSMDKKTGIGSAKPDIYSKNLPEDLSMEVVEKVSDYNTVFIAAGAAAFGAMAIDAMKNEKSIERSVLEIPMGMKDNVTYTVDRHHQFTNNTGDGEKTDKYGVLRTSYEVKAGKTGGQLKVARNNIAAIAAEAFGK
jgi:hypothetical protein